MRQSRWWSRLGRKDRQSMIGEGTQSTNQRRHTYVQDNVEVGFFTDPSVCIGCKACEVACKEWNEVPDDGFTWTGNSYDNTGHLGASTWRHVMFLEQDRQKGNQIAGPHSLGDATRRSVSLGFSVRCLQALRRSRLPRSVSDRLNRAHRSRFGPCAERCLQRLRLLRCLLSFWCDRSPAEAASRCRRRVQMHILLRSTKERTRSRMRESLPDRIDRVRPTR